MAKNKGVLAYFADSGQRKIADFRDFGPFWASQKATKLAKIRAFWLILRIPDSAKLQIFVILDQFGFSESAKMAKVKAFWPILRIPESAKSQICVILDYFGLPKKPPKWPKEGLFWSIFADCGKRKIADFCAFGPFWASQKLPTGPKYRGFCLFRGFRKAQNCSFVIFDPNKGWSRGLLEHPRLSHS